MSETPGTVVTVESMVLHRPPPTHDQKVIKSLFAVMGMLFAVALILSLGLCIYFIRSKSDSEAVSNRQRADLTAQVTALTKQLTDSRSDTDAALATKQAKDACVAAYGRVITVAAGTNAHSLNELIAAVTDPLATSAERATAYIAKRAALIDADHAYQAAIVIRDAYVGGPQLLPCPIDVN